MNLWERFLAWLKELFGGGAQPVPPSGDLIPLRPRVLLITFDPKLPSKSGMTLAQYMNWNNVDDLVQGYIADVRECSAGLVEYQVAERITVDGWPVKKDGFQYDERSYLVCLEGREAWHPDDEVSYDAIIAEFGILGRIQSGEIDEVWLFGFPYAGFWESIMGGPGAIRCNAPSTLYSPGVSRRFVIMGFNYQTGVGEMLEDLGHRVEAVLSHVWSHAPQEQNLWEQFVLHYDSHRPALSQFGCGSVHCPPNTDKDYEWDNPRTVLSNCDDWMNFPTFQGLWRQVDLHEWGGTIRAHHRWWLRHLPKAAGVTQGIANYWWRYAVDPNTIP